MDTPDFTVDFVQTVDPTGLYGNKFLGEPPAIPPAGAIRNALLHATGVAVNSLPLNPQKLVEHFAAAVGCYKGGKAMYDIDSILQAHDIQEAINALAADEGASSFGGSDVLIKIREGKLAGSRLVSIHDISALKGVSMQGDGTLVIGAATSFAHITQSPFDSKAHSGAGRGGGSSGGPQNSQYRHHRRQCVQRCNQRRQRQHLVCAECQAAPCGQKRRAHCAHCRILRRAWAHRACAR